MKTLVEIGSAVLAVAIVVGNAAAQLTLPPEPALPIAPPTFAPVVPAAPVAPAPLSPALTGRPAVLDKGGVLLLENDRILEGEIERIGGRYRIRRSVGELWIPCDKARRLCRDLDEAFVLMQSQANLRDPDERLRLARWCQANGLKERALAEARVALDMRPEHNETLQLVQILQRSILSRPTAAKTPTAPTPQAALALPPALDISDDVFVAFSSRVQPILINACYSCHHPGKATSFVLSKASEGNYRTSAQKNLAAILEYVNVEKTVLSPLLIKAVVAHGGATQAPLKGRQSAPFQTMQTWVEQLVAMNPHLREIRRASATMPGTMPGTPIGSSVFGPSTSAKHVYGEEARPASYPSEPSIVSKPRMSEPRMSEPPAIPPAIPPAMPPALRQSLSPLQPAAPPLVPATSRVPSVSAPLSAPPMSCDPFDADEFNRQSAPRN